MFLYLLKTSFNWGLGLDLESIQIKFFKKFFICVFSFYIIFLPLCYWLVNFLSLSLSISLSIPFFLYIYLTFFLSFFLNSHLFLSFFLSFLTILYPSIIFLLFCYFLSLTFFLSIYISFILSQSSFFPFFHAFFHAFFLSFSMHICSFLSSFLFSLSSVMLPWLFCTFQYLAALNLFSRLKKVLIDLSLFQNSRVLAELKLPFYIIVFFFVPLHCLFHKIYINQKQYS